MLSATYYLYDVKLKHAHLCGYLPSVISEIHRKMFLSFTLYLERAHAAIPVFYLPQTPIVPCKAFNIEQMSIHLSIHLLSNPLIPGQGCGGPGAYPSIH